MFFQYGTILNSCFTVMAIYGRHVFLIRAFYETPIYSHFYPKFHCCTFFLKSGHFVFLDFMQPCSNSGLLISSAADIPTFFTFLLFSFPNAQNFSESSDFYSFCQLSKKWGFMVQMLETMDPNALFQYIKWRSTRVSQKLEILKNNKKAVLHMLHQNYC